MEAYCYIPTLTKKAKNAVIHALKVIDYPITYFEDLQHFHKALKVSNQCMIVVEESAFYSMDRSQLPSESFVVVILKNAINNLPEETRSSIVGDAFIPCPNGVINSQELVTLLEKRNKVSIFGLDHYLPNSSVCETHQLRDTTSKERLLDHLANLFQRFGEGSRSTWYARHGEIIAIALDEIIINAVMHAVPRYKKNDLNQGFELSEDEEIAVEWRYDGRHFSFSVTDPFGTLCKDAALQHIIQDLRARTDVLNRRSLGIGLQQSMLHLEKLVINIHAGVKTEIICIFDLEKPPGMTGSLPPSFYYFNSTRCPKSKAR